MGKPKEKKSRDDIIDEMWDNLVKSAFDFFEQALKDFKQKNPKYSILHLAISVELFLKARLMAEHWTLMINGDPSYSKLIDNSINSLSIRTAIDRINNVLVMQEHVDQDSSDLFIFLADERNKVAHFYNKDACKDACPEQNNLATMEVRVWLYIHILLTEKWKKVFEDYKKQIRDLEESMKKHRQYLGEVYQFKKREIDICRKRGRKVSQCPACNFESLVGLLEKDVCHRHVCKVCSYTQTRTEKECTKCKKTTQYEMYSGRTDVGFFGYYKCAECDLEKIFFNYICPDCSDEKLIEEGHYKCSCGLETSPELLLEYLDSVSGGADALPEVTCSYCENNSLSDVRCQALRNDYICLSCFEDFAYYEIHNCEFCGSPYAGPEIEDSYGYGCMHCGGKWEYEEAKEDAQSRAKREVGNEESD